MGKASPRRKSSRRAAPRPRRYGPEERARAAKVRALLARRHPHAACALHHRGPYELLVATILSAQCTDARVNLVTPEFFERWPTPAALARADVREVEQVVRSTGFFRNKARNLVGMAQRLEEAYGGDVPRAMEDLLTLPGVARKTANVVRGVSFALADGFVVDTHVARISRLLGWTRQKDPVKIERDLMALHPKTSWIDLGHRLIHHGREVCIAGRPRCPDCPLRDLCPSAR